ncbi:MAG: hypothetical protein NW216_13590 [Hyphomicrobium sp.]|nr:hypothetical protein [Hyphomicrobium sp.]
MARRSGAWRSEARHSAQGAAIDDRSPLGFRALRAILGVALVVASVSTARAQEPTVAAKPGDEGGIRVFSVDLSGLGPPKARPETKDDGTGWRTSFGSERRSPARYTLAGGPFDADLVLVQGIRDVRALRQWFPAKAWKLVVSRQFLGDDARRRSPNEGSAAGPAATGIAIRYQPGMRVTGQDHLFDLAGDNLDGNRSVPAGTAVRVKIGEAMISALSVHLSVGCPGDVSRPTCPANPGIQNWRNGLAPEDIVVIGGRYPISEPAGSAPDAAPAKTGCAGLGIEAHVAAVERGGGSSGTPGPIQTGAAQLEPGQGCIARLVLRK